MEVEIGIFRSVGVLRDEKPKFKISELGKMDPVGEDG